MSRYACRRCDWQPPDEDPREALCAHAIERGHQLCIVCGLSLAHDEPQTCMRCVDQVRQDMREIEQLYALLPGMLADAVYGQPGKPREGGASTEDPLPGGVLLTMLAPGSAGAQAQGHEENADNRPDDPPSVAFELSRWEDDWRSVRGEPAALEEANVSGAREYLDRRLLWAANSHPAFDEFASDVRALLGKVRGAASMAERPETGAPCFECSAALERGWGETGLSDDWHCPRCRRTYTQAAYWLAVRARLEKARTA